MVLLFLSSRTNGNLSLGEAYIHTGQTGLLRRFAINQRVPPPFDVKAARIPPIGIMAHHHGLLRGFPFRRFLSSEAPTMLQRRMHLRALSATLRLSLASGTHIHNRLRLWSAQIHRHPHIPIRHIRTIIPKLRPPTSLRIFHTTGNLTSFYQAHLRHRRR